VADAAVRAATAAAAAALLGVARTTTTTTTTTTKKKRQRAEVKAEWSAAHGWHFKVPKAQGGAALSGGGASGLAGSTVLDVHRSGVLFTTDALRAAAAASERAAAAFAQAQAAVVGEVLAVAASYAPLFRRLAALLAEVDALAALAETAAVLGWCRPTLVEAADDATSGPAVELVLVGLRHPLVEANLSASGVASAVVPNDVRLGGLSGRLAIVTGPNCGGKSTLLAAVGVAQYLAQCGSFVPCARAAVPLVRRLVARTGGADAPTRGVSSFMAEMLETATLVRRAGPRTLCLVDELGRGTSTHDGLGVRCRGPRRLLACWRSFFFCSRCVARTRTMRASPARYRVLSRWRGRWRWRWVAAAARPSSRPTSTSSRRLTNSRKPPRKTCTWRST
jgi:DNA mismatch repair ATPase MutS